MLQILEIVQLLCLWTLWCVRLGSHKSHCGHLSLIIAISMMDSILFDVIVIPILFNDDLQRCSDLFVLGVAVEDTFHI